MPAIAKPATKPASPLFSTGPTRKRPGWTPDALDLASLGRSHRASHPKSRIQTCTALIGEVLGVPDDYLIGLVPGSDTGAVEMAMWSLLGPRGVDVLGWEAFGKTWVNDAASQLRLDPLNLHQAEYGHLPDLGQVDFDHDVVFTWNGTASGVRVPDGDWIADDRAGLTICDATSACFAMEMPWHKLDVTTFSFQKSLGGEGGHGVIILSPRAVQRANSHTPQWPVPKLFRLAKKGKLDAAIFDGATINTPSMLVVEDAIDALLWAKSIGGLAGLCARVDTSFGYFKSWVTATPNFEFLAVDPATLSPTSVCFVVADDWFAAQDDGDQKAIVKALQAHLEDEGVAVDIGAYRDAPTGLRIWAGPTVDPEDIAALLPWVDWAYERARAAYQAAA
ncbi:MAG: phosphoserine transaminase [Bacteroidetes bacterium]|nr:phosphoserine transaminase [Bacteroidota bacterium]